MAGAPLARTPSPPQGIVNKIGTVTEHIGKGIAIANTLKTVAPYVRSAAQLAFSLL